jgi:glucokinase
MSTAEVFALAEAWAVAPATAAAATGARAAGAATAAGVALGADMGEVAARVVDETARVLALFVINLCRSYDPALVLLGGGMAEAGPQLVGATRRHFDRCRWTCLPDVVELRQAALGQEAGVVGAAATVRGFLKPS